jgi:hypothetical protein
MQAEGVWKFPPESAGRAAGAAKSPAGTTAQAAVRDLFPGRSKLIRPGRKSHAELSFDFLEDDRRALRLAEPAGTYGWKSTAFVNAIPRVWANS